MSIGSNIKRLRESHELSQSELAKIAGVTDKAVSTWELDKKIPRMGAVEKIASHFNIPKSYILDDDDTNIKASIDKKETVRQYMQSELQELGVLPKDEEITPEKFESFLRSYEYFRKIFRDAPEEDK